MEQTASYWINQLQLQPHPEGGFYKEVFRSETEVMRPPSLLTKRACTSIYYLLEGEDFSGFHRIASDEIWYFHKGAPLHIHVIDENEEHLTLELSDESTGNLSVVVRAGLWFAAEIPSKSSFTLVSCAVAPGFEFTEFEMAVKEQLTVLYPQHADLFAKLTRQDPMK
ncbi:cupin domain-containing protein [Mucilaginibacter sp. L3T2-6]|uniref:cupin domain-containing protein n=1 Tax=Mucilaginibacter sp. L3T2-6 TaxID=3062491 RepID=UPI0026745459|nr:cupin domain-containing protein [Mucilaginibacter sp. L3T2-6]MDO3640870.1 cupin domain-containing protein [Mucilaginibacter sp. L3T2-6]MDV6213654.1 cupin domain-containing protein [Mucilaginibacter sp. L3T2-6]